MSDDQLQETLLRIAEGQDALRTVGGELFCATQADRLVAAAQALVALPQYHHLSAITAVKAAEGLRVLYHFWLGRGVTLDVACPASGATLPSLMPLLPAAEWYEREVHEMFGIAFSDHPHLAPLLLPDDWDEAPPMLGEEVSA